MTDTTGTTGDDPTNDDTTNDDTTKKWALIAGARAIVAALVAALLLFNTGEASSPSPARP